jgi:hypothetical protein
MALNFYNLLELYCFLWLSTLEYHAEWCRTREFFRNRFDKTDSLRASSQAGQVQR